MTAIFDELGIRFEYPTEWELDVSEDGPRVSITLQATGEPAFALVALDADTPEPGALVEEALAAMREEYPALDAQEAQEVVDGHTSIGYDLEFLSLDMASSCVIRGFRTPRRTVLVFAQWTDLDDDRASLYVKGLVRTLVETDC